MKTGIVQGYSFHAPTMIFNEEHTAKRKQPSATAEQHCKRRGR